MRSVKQVKRAHRIRSLKNAAACKRSAYRRKMQAKHNWQANTVFTGFRLPTVNAPTPTPRKTKEPKQRTAEEIAERQRAREQKRLEKELAKQKASTSALPKLKKTKQEKRPIEESAEKEIIHPKQQSSKKEKVKVEAEEVHEKRPRVEPEKRKGTVKEPSNETRENSVKIAKAEKKEPKIPTKELETEKKKPNAEITERKAKQPGPSESEADGKEKKSKQRAPRESDTDTKEKKAKQRAQPETDADTKERKTKQRAPPEPEADTKEKETKHSAPPASGADTKEKKAKQRAQPEPDADTKERKTKQRAPPEPEADTKERKTKQRASPETEADTKEEETKQPASRESDTDIKEKKAKQRAPTEPDADTKERKTKQRAPSEPDADTKEKETEHSAPPESGAVTKERKSKQSAQAEPAPTKSKKKGKKGAEIPMAQQHPIVEEVQLKKTEDTAPFSSAPFEHRHVDEHMVKGVRDNENGIDAPTALESTEVAERPKDNMVDEKKGAELTSGSVVVDDAKKVTVPDRSSPLAEEDGQPLNDACDDFKPEERVSLDEKREREQHNAPLENDEDVGESKSKKQRKQKGHHPESEKQDEFQQRAEHAQAVDEATKEVAGETSKKQKKKRNRKSETEHHMPSPDEIQFVEGDSIEVNDAGKVEGGDFTAVVSRRHKKKGHSPELVNAYEETHTTEPLRELDENVEEMHGEEGKLVDLKALPQAAVIEASKEIVEEVIPPPTALQTCTCEGPDNKQHTHKTTEVITTGDVPSGGQAVVDKTVTTLGAAGSPKQFAENVDKVAQEHPELMKNANIELGKHVTGKVTIATFTTRTAVTQEPMKVARRDPIMLALERGKRADLLRQRRERVYKLLPRDVEFCTRMIEAHGNDYEAMAKDPTNLYQETAKSIQRKIRIFYESPQYETYVRSKNSSPVLPPVNG